MMAVIVVSAKQIDICEFGWLVACNMYFLTWVSVAVYNDRFVLGKEGQVVQIIPSREDSLDRLVDENARQFSDEQESVESVVLHKLEVDRLHTALSLLTPEERALIQALFFDERKESELAVELGISQPAVYKRKMKILKKLKIFLEK